MRMHVRLAHLAAAAVLFTQVAGAAPVTRTVFVTVTDNKGQPIIDLTAAEVTVKEGGKDREVAKFERATPRMRLALAVEERLLGDGRVRLGLFEFVKRLADSAEISLIAVGLSNRTIVDYTADANQVLSAINNLAYTVIRDSNLSEGILELAQKFATARPERPVIVVVAISGGQAGVNPRNVLEKLGESGATMHAVTLAGGSSAAPVGALADESGREQILGDGPKQAGGRRIDVTVTDAVPKALQQVADDLLAQYAVAYTLPDGVKPNKRFNISTKRRGVTLRAPSIIPER